MYSDVFPKYTTLHLKHLEKGPFYIFMPSQKLKIDDVVSKCGLSCWCTSYSFAISALIHFRVSEFWK